MVRTKQCDVLVVGAGPVGMFAAVLLAERGLDVQLVDEAWRTTTRSYALALHPRSLALLDRVDLAAELVEQGRRLGKVAFYDATERQAELDFAGLGGGFPFLLVLPQARLERTLEDRLFDQGVRVRWNHRLATFEGAEGGGLTAKVEELGKESVGYPVMTSEWVVEKHRTYDCACLVGADGHRSSVRRLLGIDFERLAESGEEVYAVFELAYGKALDDEVRVVLAGDTANVLWPLPDGRCRWSFQVRDPAALVARRAKGRLAVQLGGDAYPYLDEEDLAHFLTARAPWFDLDGVGEIGWSVAVRFERRLASRFGAGRAWLAGDAAHLAGPIGVQSMNGGLEDAAELAGRIASLVQEEDEGAALVAYGRERQASWRRLLGVDGAVRAGSGASPWIAGHAERLAAALPAAGDDYAELARQLGLELPG